MTKQTHIVMLLSGLLVGPAFADDADDEPDEYQGENCISTRTLKRTEVVDDHHILFFMNGNKVYLNALPRECKGLSRERRFSYSTTSRNLCSFDSIRIISDFGNSMSQGRSCRLGRFHLTSIEEVEAARERGQEQPPIKAPAGADVEEIGVEEPDSP